MIACLDVDYQGEGAAVAAVVFRHWRDAAATEEVVGRVPEVEPYVPGEFYRRELPCLLAVLKSLQHTGIRLVIIDGYVWLEEGWPGLEAHLHEALGQRVPVVGVAKTRFKGNGQACPVFRGGSERALFVTAAGMAAVEAAVEVQAMHGEFRIPILLKRADQLCRGRVQGV